MPAKWTPELDCALLLAMVEVGGLRASGKGFWPAVVEKLGPDYTVRAIDQRYSAIKKRRETSGLHFHSNAAGINNATAPATPKTPRKRKAPGEATPAKKRVKKSEPTITPEDTDEDKPVKEEAVRDSEESAVKQEFVEEALGDEEDIF